MKLCFPLEMRRPIVVEQPEGSGTFVRLSDDMRKCVVYLGHPSSTPGELSPKGPRGTGFLIKVGGTPRSLYLVTAGHVARDLDDHPFSVRLNERPKGNESGRARLHHIDRASWFFHPTDDRVDLAVMPFEAPEWADVIWWPVDSFVKESELAAENVFAGDLSYVVGLLHYMPGKKRNNPAVHVGHIMLLPDGDTVTVKDWRKREDEPPQAIEIDAYVIQCEALPGSSGSPVFVRRSVQTKIGQQKVSIPGELWLLGVWRGAWFGSPADGTLAPKDSRVPFGVGTVVPTTKLCEVVEQKELSEMRNKMVNAELAKNADVPLSIGSARGIEKAGDAILRAALNAPPIQTETPKTKPAKRGRGGVSSK